MENSNSVFDLLPGVPIVESPLFEVILPNIPLNEDEVRIARDLNTKGFAVFDFPDTEIDERIERIKKDLSPKFDFNFWRNQGWADNIGLRIQDAWQYQDDVKKIAANKFVLELLKKIYGRKAFPFQTLNFPVGTQQHFHSDAVHFSSIPERFMCGVWVALEDIQADAGPLIYYPASHKWPILYNDMLGRRIGSSKSRVAQEPYEPIWRAMTEASGVEPECFLAKKGQALIWASNLLHGGSKQLNPGITRWSQVTHYYFENCSYLTPAFSDPMVGNLDLRTVRDIETEQYIDNIYVDQPIELAMQRNKSSSESENSSRLPENFDSTRYYELNPDVLASGVDAETHYLIYGEKEGRSF